jgi:hypothetical protein
MDLLNITRTLAIEATPTMPPGLDFLSTLIGWILGLASLVLFIFFVFGIVAAGKARNRGDDVTAPLWPLVAGATLGAVTGIWTLVTGI